ncbi:MAG TPA: hypothetical protein PKA82_00810 [Pyrinomonadaceae bacterium]|nr:hypothetical protein [Pyrinomonadaceae bacterium]
MTQQTRHSLMLRIGMSKSYRLRFGIRFVEILETLHWQTVYFCSHIVCKPSSDTCVNYRGGR